MRIEDGDTEGGNLVRQGGGSSLHFQDCHLSVTRPEERLMIATIKIFIDVIIVINHED